MERTNVMDLDWDILLIIDACRYDSFKETNNIKGKLSHIYSLGSDTAEWLKNTFKKKYPKLLYISGNPHISRLKTPDALGFQPFEKIVECFFEDWDDELETVLPEKLNRAFKETWDGERCIIHYLQPHHPFVGEKRIEGVIGLSTWRYKNFGASIPRHLASRLPNKITKSLGIKKTVWDMVKSGEVEVEEVHEAYVSNLKYVLRSIKELLKYPKLKGKKIIITSDHGNCFGEHGIYGHVGGKEYKELLQVPLFEVK